MQALSAEQANRTKLLRYLTHKVREITGDPGLVVTAGLVPDGVLEVVLRNDRIGSSRKLPEFIAALAMVFPSEKDGSNIMHVTEHARYDISAREQVRRFLPMMSYAFLAGQAQENDPDAWRAAQGGDLPLPGQRSR